MTKMFRSITTTFNPVTGCLFACLYCWAHELANTRLKEAYLANGNLIWQSPTPPSESFSDFYCPDPFYPRFWPERLETRFKPGEFVFVSDMGDLFGDWVPPWWIRETIEHVRKFPETDFLFCTKNPARYHEFDFPPNAVLGVTIETTEYPAGRVFTKAPSPLDRYPYFSVHPHPRKFVSIEPIMQMDVSLMVKWMERIKPEIIEVGADTRRCGLPEPGGDDVRDLLRRFREIRPNVQEKASLKRVLTK